MELSNFKNKSSLFQRYSWSGLEHEVVPQDDSGDDRGDGDGDDDDIPEVKEDDDDHMYDKDVIDVLEGRSLIPTFPQRKAPVVPKGSKSTFFYRRVLSYFDTTTNGLNASSSSARRRRECFNNLIHTHWLGGDDDGPWMIPSTGTILLDSATVKLFKFAIVSAAAILWVHAYVWIVHDKRDVTYGIREMILYDGNHIALDLLVFFIVGRLYQQTAVDTLVWIGPAIISATLQSMVATHVSSLQHSITPYEVHCAWSWQMWTLLTLGGVPFFGVIIGTHIVGSIERGIGAQKLIELLVSLAIFVLPYVGSPFFHLHHWYYGWLLGMHCNLDVWWSRLAMGVMFGVYLNGIAIFGRDPVMTCALSLYQSQNQECPYMVVNEDGLDVLHNYTLHDLARDSGADWLDGGCDNTTSKL